MKKRTLALLAALLMLGGCTAPADSGVTETVDNGVYRGRVAELTDDTMLVEQVPGHNYGYENILFTLDDDTQWEDNGFTLEADAFVEVRWDGALSRSVPPQAAAQSVTIVSIRSEGLVVNATVQDVEKTDEGWRVWAAYLEDTENTVVFIVPTDALEGITEANLTAGTRVSAVTNGIATMSMPPQIPVRALLPYTE